jgi:hypothetical protein
MKRIYISLSCLLISGFTFSQASIKLTNGQKIVIESNMDIQASLIMGMELTSKSVSVNSLEVKNSKSNSYTIGNTLTKMKVSMNVMGQANNYDSDNKATNNEEMAKLFDEKMNKQVDVIIDSKTGATLNENKKKSNATEDTDPTGGLMKLFADNSDEAIVDGAFEIVPNGKLVGDSWADTTTANDSKIIRTYTLKSVSGNEAVIQSGVLSKGTNKLNFQEMEFEVKNEMKSTGEIITDISTGLVKKRTVVSDITANMQMMGQDMPISAKATSTIIYK